MKNLKIPIIVILLFCSQFSSAQVKKTNMNGMSGMKMDMDNMLGLTPISAMGIHAHHNHKWMISYGFMSMRMKGLEANNQPLSYTYAFGKYPYLYLPYEMTMNMQMIGVMFVPSKKISLMAMGGFLSNQMSSASFFSNDATMNTSGLGDISLSAYYHLMMKNGVSLHLVGGVVLPTGHINEHRIMNMLSYTHNMFMGYSMQPGSGSYSAKTGLIWMWQNNHCAFGNQANAIIRLNNNQYDYRLGNQIRYNTWFAFRATKFLNFSVQGNIEYIGKIRGINEDMDPLMISTTDTANSGRIYLGYTIGTNFNIPIKALKDLRFAVEWALPLYQNVRGIQLEQEYGLNFRIEYLF